MNRSKFSVADFIALVSALVLGVAFFNMAWLTSGELSLVGVRLFGGIDQAFTVGDAPETVAIPFLQMGETASALLWVVPLGALVSFVVGLWGLFDITARKLSRIVLTIAGSLSLIYCGIFLSIESPAFINLIVEDNVSLGIGFWVSVFASLGLIIQLFLPRPTSNVPVFASEGKRSLGLASLSMFWLAIFFILPLIAIMAISFMSRGTSSAAEMPLTLEHYDRSLNTFGIILGRSVLMSGLTMLVCLLIGYPLAFFISTRRSKRFQQFTLFLVILPFWTNFLIRTYAWQLILGNDGVINNVLQGLGLIENSLRMLNTQGAVIVGLVYGFLPFMVLPIYASIERFDFKMVDAAHDLGANDWTVFWRVILPLTLPGVFAGSALVFIPSIGSYITPDLLGGTKGLMIGKLIGNQFRGSGNMPLGSALSVLMMGIVMISLMGYVFLGSRRGNS